jgi:predicted DNA-binding transcriptional regulator AlpA
LNRAGAVAWLRDDIEALAAGQPVPDRAEGWMQDHIVLLPELAQRLGNREDSVRTAINQNHKTVPQPHGTVGGVHYWTRAGFESWWTGCQ